MNHQTNFGSTLSLNEELAPIFIALAKQAGNAPVPEKGDWQSTRERGNAAMDAWNGLIPNFDDVVRTTYSSTSQDNTAIELRWYSRENGRSSAAVLYVHGGGMILGDINRYDNLVAGYVSNTGVSFLAVQYRLAPEVKGEKPAQDVLSALIWLRENAQKLHVDINRIAIMGDSAGGGIAAGTAILARRCGIYLKQQLLIYPMLDDRNTEPNSLLQPFATWTYDNNYTGWKALLGDDMGKDEVTSVVAPARLEDFRGLPPAYIEVGDLDIFRDEDVRYAHQLLSAGVPVELHVLRGVPHGFDRFAPDISISKMAIGNRIRVINAL